MPTYDYRCESNGHVVEVKHRMSERVSTWGELCALAGIEPGNTPLDSAVKKLITGARAVQFQNRNRVQSFHRSEKTNGDTTT